LLTIIYVALFHHAAYAVCDKNADRLIKAYPEHLIACENNYLVWRSGEKQLFDDGKKKEFEELLANPDVEDMFAFAYPVGADSYAPPDLNFDPGRIRNEAFFKRIYGGSKAEVAAHLVTIAWLPKSTRQSVKIQAVNGIAEKLAQVSAELDELPENLKKYLTPPSGTFNWRLISGTDRLSNHAFGIAIDINSRFSHYWLWTKQAYQYQNTIPLEIVEIFEKHGFIWGGKWYHYDTMHFEYRPELLIP
jgi:peptidoglycan LD-endopeptidase CwlK